MNVSVKKWKRDFLSVHSSSIDLHIEGGRDGKEIWEVRITLPATPVHKAKVVKIDGPLFRELVVAMTVALGAWDNEDLEG